MRAAKAALPTKLRAAAARKADDAQSEAHIAEDVLADADDAFLDAEEPTDLFEDEVYAQKKSVPLVLGSSTDSSRDEQIDRVTQSEME